MCFLVIEKDMGFEYVEHFFLFNAAEEEGFVCGDAPRAHGVDNALVRGGVSGGDDGDAQSGLVGRVLLVFGFFQFLNG